MKKILALVLTLVLLVSFASMAFAVTVSVDGNLRLWYGYIKNDAGAGLSETSFRFDRLALDVNAVIDENRGLISEVQFRNIMTSKDGAYTSSGELDTTDGDAVTVKNTSTTGNSVDVRVDLAYYYQKNALLNGDTFMVGAFDGQVPYKNGYGFELLSSGLGDGTKIGNAVGLVYQINKPLWGIGVGVTNAVQGTAQNDSVANNVTGESEGYNWSSRLNFTPFAGFKMGAGYAYVLDAAAVAASSTVDSSGVSTPVAATPDMWSHRLVVDMSYYNPAVCPISGMIEWSQISDQKKIKTDDSVSAVYGELALTAGKAIFYAGRAISLSDANYFQFYDQNGGFVGYSALTQKNNYTVAGVKYSVNANQFLQAEAVMVDDLNSKFDGAMTAGLRYMVTF